MKSTLLILTLSTALYAADGQAPPDKTPPVPEQAKPAPEQAKPAAEHKAKPAPEQAKLPTQKVKTDKITTRASFPATILPQDVRPIAIESDAWGSFLIEEITPHGAKVREGETLIQFDAEEYGKKLHDAESAFAASQLSLKNAEADFISAEKYKPMQLQHARQKHEEAKEAWEYFQKTRREQSTREANLELRAAELRLDSELEELKQLEKMYKADDLTENTEEIILKRQRESVKFSEAALDNARLAHKRTLEVSIPREATALEREAQSTAIALQESEANIPRNLELKRIALEDARVKFQRDKENLDKLKATQPTFTIKAPADGYFYYGVIQDGRWMVGEGTKAIGPQGLAPVNRPFVSFIPADSSYQAEAFVDEATIRDLNQGQKGYARLVGNDQQSFSVQVKKTAITPGLDGRYRVTLNINGDLPKDIVPGTNANISLVTYEKSKALLIPKKALHSSNEGTWVVEIQQDGDKPTRIPVTRGRTNGDMVEILEGLSKDQSIVVPE